MTTGSWCLTEILMSVNRCSSNSEHSHSADSTRASGVALPYLAISRLSSDPALTLIRIGVPAADAARAISPTLSSNALMLPGFTRTAAQPASIAANTYLGWKWMSAITGICDLRAISGSASASSWDGTATRTIWHPAAVSSAICCRVAFTSAVSVVVIDWTETGAPPPTGTLPTMSWRDLRRSASGGGGSPGTPRSTAITQSALLDQVNGVEQVSRHQQQAKPDQQHEHRSADRYQRLQVGHARVGPPAQPGQPCPDLLVAQHGQVPAVQREQREQVERAEEDVHRRDDLQQVPDRVLPAAAVLHGLPGDLRHAHDAADASLLVAVVGEQARNLSGQLPGRLGRAHQELTERRPRVAQGAERAVPLEDPRGADAEVGPVAARDGGRHPVQGQFLA